MDPDSGRPFADLTIPAAIEPHRPPGPAVIERRGGGLPRPWGRSA